MITDEMDKKNNTWKGMTDCQVKKLVKNTRARISDCDVFRELKIPPLSMVQNSSNFFLQFNLSIPDIETKNIHRIMGYGNLHYSVPCQAMCKYT